MTAIDSDFRSFGLFPMCSRRIGCLQPPAWKSALKEAADAARETGRCAIDPEILEKQVPLVPRGRRCRDRPNAARRSKLQKKRNALAARMRDRADDYLRFARDLQVPFDKGPAEQDIRMSKLRIKVSGCMRSMTGAEVFCAIRSYVATAARHGIGVFRRPHPRRPRRPLDPRVRPTEKNPARKPLQDAHPELQTPADLSSYAG